MHNLRKHATKRVVEARLADKNLHIVPEAIGPDNYVDYIIKNKIGHIITFNEVTPRIEKRLVEKKIQNSNYPLVVGHDVIIDPNERGIGFYKTKLVPRESFTLDGKRNLLRGAMQAYDLVSQGHQVAFTCTYGTRRSTRAHYIFRRIAGDSHEKALETSKADREEETKLQETWANRHKYLDA